jgi:hypothetical protein
VYVRKAQSWVVLAALAIAQAGCHRYVPTDFTSLLQGEEVRVYLSRAAIAALPEEVPVNGLSLSGRLMGQEPDTVVLGIRMAAMQPGIVGTDVRQMVRLGSGQIADVQRREFSPQRTALLVAGAAGATAAIITLIFAAESSLDTGDEDPDKSRVPILSIPFHVPIFGW